jgi:serine protease Do
LNNNIRYYVYGLLTAFVVSVLVLIAYHYYFGPGSDYGKAYLAEWQQEAKRSYLMSENHLRSSKAALPNEFVTAAQHSRECVVFIKSDLAAQTNASYAESSTGSGVILSDNGYIVTNHHVIKGANHIDVLLNDNREFRATVVGIDVATDLALLKIEAQQLRFLNIGNSDSLLIGEWVMAVGNPFRLQSTVTAGVVSAKARNISIYENQGIESFIQTDAAINPGNSGGALINTRGDLVGICTAVISNSGRYEGFSFAIPSTIVQKVVSDLKTYGSVQRGWLGVDIENVDQTAANNLKLDLVQGVLVSSVHKDGAAQLAGLQNLDVILTINQIVVANVAEFMGTMARYRPGDKIQMSVIRNGRKINIEAILKNQANTTEALDSAIDPIFEQMGIEIRSLTSSEKSKSGDGVMVLSVQRGSLISNTKMEPSYIITTINNTPIKSIDALTTAIQKARGKSVILRGLYLNYPGTYPYSFVVPK